MPSHFQCGSSAEPDQGGRRPDPALHGLDAGQHQAERYGHTVQDDHGGPRTRVPARHGQN